MEFEELKKKSKAAKTANRIEQKTKDMGKESTSVNEENNGNLKIGNTNENQKKKRKKQRKQNDNEEIPEKVKKVEIESETGVDTTGQDEQDLEETVSKEITYVRDLKKWVIKNCILPPRKLSRVSNYRHLINERNNNQ